MFVWIFNVWNTDEVNSPVLLLVYFVTGALAFITILCALLALTLLKVYKRISSKHTGKCSCLSVNYISHFNLKVKFLAVKMYLIFLNRSNRSVLWYDWKGEFHCVRMNTWVSVVFEDDQSMIIYIIANCPFNQLLPLYSLYMGDIIDIVNQNKTSFLSDYF